MSTEPIVEGYSSFTYTKDCYDFLRQQHELGNGAWFAIPEAIRDGLFLGVEDSKITADQVENMLHLWDKAGRRAWASEEGITPR